MQHPALIYKKHKQILPLLLLAAFCVVTAVTVLASDKVYILNAKHYAAFIAVAINFVLYFGFRRYYKFGIALTLFLGLFNALLFSIDDTKAGVKIIDLWIMVQPTAAIATLLLYILNFKRANRWVVGLLQPYSQPGEKEAYHKKLFEEEVKKFKERFRTLSAEELAEKHKTGHLTAAAREAIRRLLDEKGSTD